MNFRTILFRFHTAKVMTFRINVTVEEMDCNVRSLPLLEISESTSYWPYLDQLKKALPTLEDDLKTCGIVDWETFYAATRLESKEIDVKKRRALKNLLLALEYRMFFPYEKEEIQISDTFRSLFAFNTVVDFKNLLKKFFN